MATGRKSEEFADPYLDPERTSTTGPQIRIIDGERTWVTKWTMEFTRSAE